MAEGLLGRLGGRGASSKNSDKKFEVALSDEEWRRKLSPEAYRVLRQHGTERAGTKFNSGTGWPSFWTPLEDAVETETDRSLFMSRTEVHCRRCGGHLGHVFEDGPAPTGQRYCMNGASLDFHTGEATPASNKPEKP